MKKLATAIFVLIIFVGCSNKSEDTVWIYTSQPPDEVNVLAKVIKEKFPDIDVQWYAEGGSENVQARIAMENLSGGSKANIVNTSDVFWFEKMAKEGSWAEYKPAIDYKIPEQFSVLNPNYSVKEINLFGIAYNKKFIKPEDAPKSFKELVDVKYKGKVACGSPLESGTNYILMANLAHRYGYDFLKQLRTNDLSSTGGNSVTIRRMISGERPIGMVPLEWISLNRDKASDLEVVYPEDGAIIIPDPIGILKTTKNMEAAQKIANFILSNEGQQIGIKYGSNYSTNINLAPPNGMKPLGEMLSRTFPLDKDLLTFVQTEGEKFKDKYSEIMFAQ